MHLLLMMALNGEPVVPLRRTGTSRLFVLLVLLAAAIIVAMRGPA